MAHSYALDTRSCLWKCAGDSDSVCCYYIKLLLKYISQCRVMKSKRCDMNTGMSSLFLSHCLLHSCYFIGEGVDQSGAVKLSVVMKATHSNQMSSYHLGSREGEENKNRKKK